VYPWFVTRQDVVGGLAHGALPQSYRYVQDFKSIADKRGVPSLIALLPTAGAAPFDRISTQLHHDKVAFIDLTTLRSEFTLEQFRASRFDPHASAAVHRRIGETLAEYILQSRLNTSLAARQR
ncbi:MAG: hypothetical protein ACREIH_01955, partial [Nitrospiraceae bacterium]